MCWIWLRSWDLGLDLWPKALIPKGEGVQSTSMRSLSVLSNIYRLWAAISVKDVLDWQVKWIHPFAYGFRRHKGTGDACTLLTTMMDKIRWIWIKKNLLVHNLKLRDGTPQHIILIIFCNLPCPAYPKTWTFIFRDLYNFYLFERCHAYFSGSGIVCALY